MKRLIIMDLILVIMAIVFAVGVNKFVFAGKYEQAAKDAAFQTNAKLSGQKVRIYYKIRQSDYERLKAIKLEAAVVAINQNPERAIRVSKVLNEIIERIDTEDRIITYETEMTTEERFDILEGWINRLKRKVELLEKKKR